MIKFRFFSIGMSPNSRKNYLSSACKNLSNIFTIADIKPGMFSPSITKRLMQAKKHGTKIIIRKGGRGWGWSIGVQVVNKEDHKIDLDKRKKKLKSLKFWLKQFSKSNEVQIYLRLLKKISNISGYEDFYPKEEFK